MKGKRLIDQLAEFELEPAQPETDNPYLGRDSDYYNGESSRSVVSMRRNRDHRSFDDGVKIGSKDR